MSQYINEIQKVGKKYTNRGLKWRAYGIQKQIMIVFEDFQKFYQTNRIATKNLAD